MRNRAALVLGWFGVALAWGGVQLFVAATRVLGWAHRVRR